MSTTHDATKKRNAFTGSTYQRLGAQIRNMANKARRLSWTDWTHTELMQLFVPAPWRDALELAYEVSEGESPQTLYAAVNSNPAVVQDGWVWRDARFCFTMMFHRSTVGFVVPKQGRRPGNPACFQPDADPQLVEKYDDFVAQQTRISFEYGQMMFVLNQLNLSCSTPTQVRYLWPSIVPLLRMAGLDQMARQLIAPSSRAGDGADCLPVVRDCLKPSYETMAKAMILADVENSDRDAPAINYAPYEDVFWNKHHGVSFGGV
jgi:hypothetical protein